MTRKKLVYGQYIYNFFLNVFEVESSCRIHKYRVRHVKQHVKHKTVELEMRYGPYPLEASSLKVKI